jgi:exosortase E/protease (VPEID-CTERM system)
MSVDLTDESGPASAGILLERPSSQGPLDHARSFPLAQRLAALAALFAVELIAISIWLDTAAIDGRPGLVGLVSDFGSMALRAVVTFAAVFVTFTYFRAKERLQQISAELRGSPISWRLLASHVGAMIVFCVLSSMLFSGAAGHSGNLVVAMWLLSGSLGIVFAGFAVIPPTCCWSILRSSGWVWVYASAGAVAANLLAGRNKFLWGPASALTFKLVKVLLRPFLAGVVADPARLIIGTAKFRVSIAPGCSGLEGAGLIVVFTVSWLWFFRHECRFPRALLLIPAGVGILYLLNAVRIAALILIGNAGAREVALGGFHSQTGWITFNAVALGLSIATRRWSWLRRPEVTAVSEEKSAPNAVAPYLMPFLVILATAMISRAASSDFDWLYPLRFFAAVACIWFFRAKYRNLDWRVGWLSPVVGVVGFALWMGLDRLSGAHAAGGIGVGLARLPEAARLSWLGFRVLAAVVTVPIAEELAFRGFLIRRLISSDFESVSMTKFTWLSVLGSSLAFGLMHGDRWIAGILAGLLYAGALLWRGRIGDAVVAHGTTNALLAVWVLMSHDWSLW